MFDNINSTTKNHRSWLGMLVTCGIVLNGLTRSIIADDTIIGSIGGRLVPLNSKHIRLVSEKVHVKLHPRAGSVWCRFVFKNECPAARVKVGFPQELGNAPLRRFHCTVDGQAVRVRRHLVRVRHVVAATDYEHPYEGWHWWWMRFGRNEMKTVVNRYWAEASFDGNGEYWFSYLLKTGATWKGPISQADVDIDIGDVPESDIYSITPPGYRREGHRIVWSWKKFKPRQDIMVAWNPNPGVYIQSTGEDSVLPDPLPAKKCLLHGRIFVPVCRLAKSLGLRCDAEANERKIVVHRSKVDDHRRVIFELGSRKVQIRQTDGTEEMHVSLAPVFRLKGETMAPLRMIADTLNWGLEFKRHTDEGEGGRYEVTIMSSDR